MKKLAWIGTLSSIVAVIIALPTIMAMMAESSAWEDKYATVQAVDLLATITQQEILQNRIASLEEQISRRRDYIREVRYEYKKRGELIPADAEKEIDKINAEIEALYRQIQQNEEKLKSLDKRSH